MSKYTTQLRYLIENNFNLGLDKYPIFDENYRKILNRKIIEHYFFQEIGFETAELFKIFLNRTLNEIMPYYNQLYKSELLVFNPFYNVDRIETGNKNNNNISEMKNKTVSDNTANTNVDSNTTSKGVDETESTTISDKTGTTKNKSKTIDSDTPQEKISVDGIFNNEVYASKASYNESDNSIISDKSKTTDNSTSNSSSDSKNKTQSQSLATADTTSENVANNTGLENYLNHVQGNQGENYSDMLLKYRETFLNIDMLIINELKDLFMLIY